MYHVIAFVKNEGNNLMTMAIKICFIIDYYSLKLQRFYKYTYFGHIMSKACKNVIKQ
jgi:hypothetical protein